MYHRDRTGKPGRPRTRNPILTCVAEGVAAHFTDDGAAAVAAAIEAGRSHNAAEVTSEHLLGTLLLSSLVSVSNNFVQLHYWFVNP